MATRRQPAQPEGLKTALSASQLDRIILGDALEVLRELPDASVDAIVTDPPAGISFMGKGWDSDKGGRDAWIVWLAEVMREALRVVKPGGHALVWALPRTSHWTAMALEDAGWEIRERIAHINGQGFPKSLDVSKAIDKAAGAQREVVGTKIRLGDARVYPRNAQTGFAPSVKQGSITTPATDAARAWDGWGTALKPAVEDWWLCRKPLAEPTVAANVLRWGTGALNIGASRVGIEPIRTPCVRIGSGNTYKMSGYTTPDDWQGDIREGRWPANLLLSHAADCQPTACSLWCPVRELDAQSGVCKSGAKGDYPARFTSATYGTSRTHGTRTYEASEGGASRYFATFRYVAKASRRERNRGCEGLPERGVQEYGTIRPNRAAGYDKASVATNSHPTVKPIALMTWLITLITPPGGVVLDPFAGSGSTLVSAKAGGWRYIGIEREAEYVAIAEARLAATAEPSLGSAVLMERPKAATATPRKRKANQPTQPLWEGQEMRA